MVEWSLDSITKWLVFNNISVTIARLGMFYLAIIIANKIVRLLIIAPSDTMKDSEDKVSMSIST